MKLKHCYEIDYLRIIGAISVLLYHYTFRHILINNEEISLFPLIGHVTRYGYLGVNLFFIISGFVILFSASKKSALKFGFSRVDRLYPTYWACVTISSIAILIFDGNFPNFKIFLSNLTMLNDYLNIKDIDGVYWTLHVELKFYFLIFILIFILITLKLIQRYYLYLSIWLILSYIYYFTHEPFFMGWFISPFYSSYFISGISLFLLYHGDKSLKNVFILLFSIILSVAYAWDQTSGFIRDASYYDRIISCFVIVIIYLFFISFSLKKNVIHSRDLVVKLSMLTYSLYLMHASVGKRICDYMMFNFSMNKYITVIMVSSIVFFLSFAVNRYVEIPTRGKIIKIAERFCHKIGVKI